MLFDRAALRRIDRVAVEKFGIPSLVLMENAANACTGAVIETLGRRLRRGVVICCGRGNNGGDGLAVARQLHNAGVKVALLAVARPSTYAGDAGVQMRIVRRMKIPVAVMDAKRPGDTLRRLDRVVGGTAVIVDAVFGTGLKGKVEGSAAALIGEINASRDRGVRVVSVDLPSGMDCDSGEGLVAGAADGRRAVVADVTVSMVGPKVGFARAASRPYLRRVSVADIGAPRELIERCGRPMEKGRG